MTTVASVRLKAYASLAALALVAAIAVGPPELAALAVPFLALVAVGLAGAASLALDGTLRLGQERALEGEPVTATMTIGNVGAAARVELCLPTTTRLAAEPTPIAIWLPRGGQRAISLELFAERWGVQGAGPAVVRGRDRLGAFAVEGPLGGSFGFACIRRGAPPRLDRAASHAAGTGESGVAGTRRGHRVRRPPAARARRPREEHQLACRARPGAARERAASRARRGRGAVPRHVRGGRARERGTLDAAVQAAVALASAYLARRDRVALVSFGGELRWLAPATGRRQLYRIVDALLLSDESQHFLEGGRRAAAPPAPAARWCSH